MQREGTEWVETSTVLLLGVKGGPGELAVKHADSASTSDVVVSSEDTMKTVVRTPDKTRTNFFRLFIL